MERIVAGINTTAEQWRYVYSSEARTRLDRLVRFARTAPERNSEEAAASACRNAEVVLTTWGAVPFTEQVLQACPSLRLVLHAAGTVKGFVTDALLARGIRVVSAVRLNAIPVAEFTLGVILAGLKDVVANHHRFLRDGRDGWVRDKTGFPRGYYHTSIGIVGLGEISRHLIRLLRNFEMDVFVVSSHLTDDEAERDGVRRASLEWVMEHCDVISLHAADIPRNRGLINRHNLRLLKPGARLINTARGNLINEEDLVEALMTRDIEAYLDVTSPEPPEPGHPFYSLENCILSPHISGSYGRESQRLGDFVVDELERFLTDEPLTGEVDLRSFRDRA